MKLEAYLIRSRAVIDNGLQRYMRSIAEAPRELRRAIHYAVFSGGKRLRPILTIVSCRACGGTVREALAPACAVELVHTYSLIHDDLPAMDDDDMRRGMPTVHRRFGEAVAILAGDALLSHAFEVLARYPDPVRGLVMVRELALASGAAGMVGGQVDDVTCASKALHARAITALHRRKTARLFEASAKLGAIAAGAGRRAQGSFGRFGELFGLAFQIVDDIADGGAYVKRYGAATAQEDAERLMREAKRTLSAYGPRCGVLSEIADLALHKIPE